MIAKLRTKKALLPVMALSFVLHSIVELEVVDEWGVCMHACRHIYLILFVPCDIQMLVSQYVQNPPECDWSNPDQLLSGICPLALIQKVHYSIKYAYT